jgi:hypothetical protein
MEQTECSETSAYKLQTPGNYPKESVQHLEHGESLKSGMYMLFTLLWYCDGMRIFLWWLLKITDMVMGQDVHIISQANLVS